MIKYTEITKITNKITKEKYEIITKGRIELIVKIVHIIKVKLYKWRNK